MIALLLAGCLEHGDVVIITLQSISVYDLMESDGEEYIEPAPEAWEYTYPEVPFYPIEEEPEDEIPWP